MFGTYTFKYEPASEETDKIYPAINFSLSGEADLSEVLECFKDFLSASKFPINFEDELEIRVFNSNKND